jgi:hypothetical protein
VISTALFYTLSTIAQTLAGVLAILLAVVLYSFTRVTDAIHGGPEHPHHERAKRVRPQLRWAVRLSLIDIGLCFVVLPLTPVLAPCAALAVGTFVVIIGGGIWCLFLYWRLMASMVELL